MNNDEYYISLKCDECGEPDFSIRICNKCKKKYCRYKCENKIVYVFNIPICKPCYNEKVK